MKAYTGEKTLPQEERGMRSNIWAKAIKNNEESPGSFIYAGPVTEAINLAAVALRSKAENGYETVEIKYDTENMKITNKEEANKYLTREYRKGWEL